MFKFLVTPNIKGFFGKLQYPIKNCPGANWQSASPACNQAGVRRVCNLLCVKTYNEFVYNRFEFYLYNKT